MATTRASPSTDRRSLRAADQPIETWSSCIALEGIESTLAGTASRLSSETIAAWVYWAIMWPRVDARVVGQERRQPVAAGPVEEPVGAALGDRGDVGGGDGEEVQHVGDRGAVEVAVGLHPAVLERPPGCRWPRPAPGRRPGRRGRRCRGRRRAPAGSSAASRRPAPGCSPGPRWLATIAGVGQQPAPGWRPRRPGPGAGAAPAGRRRRPGRCRAGPPRSSPRRRRRP